MTPAARLAAAIEILDRIGPLAAPTEVAAAAQHPGGRADRILTDWARGHRFAGSGDRRAIRDHVFDVLRRRRSLAWLGGSDSGRGLVLGLLRSQGRDPAALFDGQRFAPPPPGPDEAGLPLSEAPEAVRLDLPDWLLQPLRESLLGPGGQGDLAAVLGDMGRRAPIWLRANLARADRATIAAQLAEDGVETRPDRAVATALEVVSGEGRLRQAQALADGLVEPQDIASQAVVAELGDLAGLEVLDYCAGAGGKSLHLAAAGARVTAHDALPARMADLGPRAARAGVRIATTADPAAEGRQWPLVLVDAPCSGSGTWRRDPEAKWRLTPARLAELMALQDSILDAAAARTAPGGRLAFVTCSLLELELGERAAAFLTRHPGWELRHDRRFRPGAPGDGFSLIVLARPA